MRIYARYIALRIAGPLLLISFSLTALVWLAQSLRFIDFIVNRGLDATMFLYLSSLLIPSLLGIVLPIALFLSIIIAYNKLSQESEIVVLKSSGISKLGLIAPAVRVSIFITLIGYIISLYLLPTSYREFKDMQAFIRDNYVSVLLQEGVFNSPTKDLTVYIRQINENGELKGMLMHDRRVAEKPVTMMAEQGKLIKTQNGPRFILINGNRQEVDQKNVQLSLLYFDRYALDLSTFAGESSKRWREPEERFIGELFNPTDVTNERLFQKLAAEGHYRITWPLYSILLCLIALTPFVGGEFNRRGQWQRILYASVASLITISFALSVKSLVAKSAEFVPLMYGISIGGIILCLFILLRDNNKASKSSIIEEPL